jgi:DNA repair exonuclease SbcCD ATPase subunit
MSTPESPFSPSRQVERIREILVGRQFASVERRLDRLEYRVVPPNGQRPSAAPAVVATPLEPPPPAAWERLEQRLESERDERREAAAALAARIHEALEQLSRRVDACPPATEFDERLGSMRDEFRQEQTRLQNEIRQENRLRLEAIQDLAGRVAALAAAAPKPAAHESQEVALQRLRASLDDWQRRLVEYLQNRERWLIDQLRAELEHLRDDTWHWLGELHRSKVDRAELETRWMRPGAGTPPPSPWQPPLG